MPFSAHLHSQDRILAAEAIGMASLPAAAEAAVLAAIDALPDAENMIVRVDVEGELVQGADAGSSGSSSAGLLSIRVELIQLSPQ